MSTITSAICLLLLASIAFAMPGAPVEHKGDPTPAMLRAIDMVIEHINKMDVHEHVRLTKIDRIMTQVVAGNMYHLDIRVQSEFSSELAICAKVYHKFDDSMEVHSVQHGRRPKKRIVPIHEPFERIGKRVSRTSHDQQDPNSSR